jgi:DtxR family Mn-dependent transcriptional regulator
VADPITALGWFAVVVVVLAVFFWPGLGLVARMSRMAGLTERVLLEDALKHLYNCEYAQQSASLDSLAGAIGVTRGRAVDLLKRLEEKDLVRSEPAGPQLTEDGRTYALRILRTHRLWERYLADRTGVKPSQWHREAERLEHTTSEAEANRLSASLGHPVYDPHGDPIPTQEGQVPPAVGVPMTALRPGEVATILHLEDEPASVYQRLLDEGLHPLMVVRALPGQRGTVRIETEGRELTLEAVDAGNVTVNVLQPSEMGSTGATATLGDLPFGRTGVVTGISRICQGPQRRRLLDLGVVPGTHIRAELRSASGDPVAYSIRGALIGLRQQQASWIYIEEPEAGTDGPTPNGTLAEVVG